MSFIYNGITYSTLSDAANKLGISQPYLSSLRKTRNLTDEEAVKYALEQKDTAHTRGNNQECIVFGRKHSSISEACRFYQIPYISLRSRMARNNETVEEAIGMLLRTREKKQNEPIYFSKNLLENKLDNLPDSVPSSFRGLIKKLILRGYTPVFYSRKNTGIPIVGIEKPITDNIDIRIWLLVDDMQTSIFASDFCFPTGADKKLELFEQINTLNACSTGARFWLSENKVTGNLELLAGFRIPHTKKYETPVLSVLREIEYMFEYCKKVSEEFK